MLKSATPGKENQGSTVQPSNNAPMQAKSLSQYAILPRTAGILIEMQIVRIDDEMDGAPPPAHGAFIAEVIKQLSINITHIEKADAARDVIHVGQF